MTKKGITNAQKEAMKKYSNSSLRINTAVSENTELYKMINDLMFDYNIKSPATLAKICIKMVYESGQDLTRYIDK